ncbi:MAG: PH domain-containing protein [Tepidisphaeraceae bacterium]
MQPDDAKRRSSLLTPATEAADAVDAAVGTPLATLIVGNVIPQGEIVQLLIKPSRWFVLLNSFRFAVITAVLIALLHVLGVPVMLSKSLTIQFGLFLIAGRVMWSTVEWMGLYYILTDLRVVRVSGIFSIQIQSCPLRKVEAVNFYTTVGERLLGKGCIEMTNPEKKMTWQSVGRPHRIHRMVAAAVARAKSNGCGPA